jgi:hypothetical protein
VIKRIGAVHATYFEGIQIDPEFLGEKRAVVRYQGFETRHAIIRQAIMGFYRKALQISGAKDVTTRFRKPIATGGTAELEIAWA